MSTLQIYIQVLIYDCMRNWMKSMKSSTRLVFFMDTSNFITENHASLLITWTDSDIFSFFYLGAQMCRVVRFLAYRPNIHENVIKKIWLLRKPPYGGKIWAEESSFNFSLIENPKIRMIYWIHGNASEMRSRSRLTRHLYLSFSRSSQFIFFSSLD